MYRPQSYERYCISIRFKLKTRNQFVCNTNDKNTKATEVMISMAVFEKM